MKCPGPVGIVDAIGDTYQESRPDGWFYVAMNLLMMAILLSVNLGVMNLPAYPCTGWRTAGILDYRSHPRKGTSGREREHGALSGLRVPHGTDGADSF